MKLKVDSLKTSSVKDSPSSFFCHHLLPLPPLVFLSPSLFSYTVRKDYLWRDNSVPSRTGKDGGPQTLLQWVTLTAGGICKDKIWVLVFFDAAALPWAAHASAKCLWISHPRTWAYLPEISAVSLVCAAGAFPSPAPSAVLFALCLRHVCDMCAWTMRAEKGSVTLVMAYVFVPVSAPLEWCKMASHGDVSPLRLLLLLSGSISKSLPHCAVQRSKKWAWTVHARNDILLCSFSQSPHGRLLLAGPGCSLWCSGKKAAKSWGDGDKWDWWMNLVKFLERACHTVSTRHVSVKLKINRNSSRIWIDWCWNSKEIMDNDFSVIQPIIWVAISNLRKLCSILTAMENHPP